LRNAAPTIRAFYNKSCNMSNYPHSSLWWDTLQESLKQANRPALDGDLDVDVAIVGAGFTGLWTAYYLQGRNPSLRIAIVEAQVAGFGASGRNGGWCSALFPTGIDKLARMFGRDKALAMQDAMHATVHEVERVITKEHIDCEWQRGGTLVLARSQVQLEAAHSEIADWRLWGYGESDYILLNAQLASARAKATKVLGATWTPHCAALHPAKLVRSLANLVESRGVKIYENTQALKISPHAVATSNGVVSAAYVVRATEGYTAQLAGHKRDVAPIYSLMIATEPLSESMWDEIGLSNRETFSDYRNVIIYGQRTADNRLAFGGRGAPYHFGSQIDQRFDLHPQVHAALYATLIEMFPVIAGTKITHSWGGSLGVARDWMASCGLEKSTGLAWAGGYVGDGVGTSNLAGRTLADLITGTDSDLTELPWVNHKSRKWEPEPLRWLGINLGLKAMTIADRTELRSRKRSRLAHFANRFIGH